MNKQYEEILKFRTGFESREDVTGYEHLRQQQNGHFNKKEAQSHDNDNRKR